MATIERIIPAQIADDGSVHYTSVMSPPDDSIAVCYMVPDRIIPVIFVPGVMGSNLHAATATQSSTPVWLVDGKTSLASWVFKDAAFRKQTLHPAKTDICEKGAIPSGTKQSKAELRRRGWGTVANMSYGEFLVWLENALNDVDASTDHGRKGLRAQLMHQLVAQAPGVNTLTHAEVALSYKYQFPVHAVGYNWLQSNAVSAERLNQQIERFTNHYRQFGFHGNTSLLQRGQQALAVIAEAGNKVIRKGPVDLPGMKAEELLIAGPTVVELPGHTFSLEINSTTSGPHTPFLSLDMINGGAKYDENDREIEKASLTEGEAIALWDAVSRTLRIRPNGL